MARRLRFKPSLSDQRRGNDRAMQMLCGGNAPAEVLNNLPPKRERATPRKLEAPVIDTISDLLRVHPRVLWAARFNSGAAGEFSHIWFHKFLRVPEPMRMPDFFGLIFKTIAVIEGAAYHHIEIGQPFAVEAKAPGWTKPRDDREREQAAFLAMIRDAGGIGIFATDVSQVAKAFA